MTVQPLEPEQDISAQTICQPFPVRFPCAPHKRLTLPYISARINGADEVLRFLGDVDNRVEPQSEISDRCVKLIECLPALQHDPHRPEDVLKVEVDEDR